MISSAARPNGDPTAGAGEFALLPTGEDLADLAAIADGPISGMEDDDNPLVPGRP
jgi:hypothetical protein